MAFVARVVVPGAAVALAALFVLSGAVPKAPGAALPDHLPGVPPRAATATPSMPANASGSSLQPIGGRLFNSSTSLPDGAANSVTGIAIDPSDQHVYAANEYAGTVTEFDESNGTVLDAVTVAVFAQGTFPDGLALDAAGHRLFVSISTAYTGPRASGWLLILNETTLATEGNLSFASAPITPFEPTYLAYDAPSDQLFVENQSWGYLAIVNLTPGWTTTSYLDCPVVDCAYHGYGLLDVPRYHTLVVPTCAEQLWFVNTSNDSTRALVTGPPNSLMAWAAYDSANDQLWVMNYTFNGHAGSFFEYNLTTLVRETNVPGAPPRGTDLLYDPTANVLIATDTNGSLSIHTYYASNATAIASYSSGSSGSHPFYTMAFDPTTQIAIAAGLGNGTTVAFDIPSLSISDVYPAIPTVQPLVGVDPGTGEYFVGTDGPSTVRAVNETTGVTLWSDPLSAPYGPAGSDLTALTVVPSIGTVFVADSGAGVVYAINATTGAVPLSGPLPPGATVCSLLWDPSAGSVLAGTEAGIYEFDPATLGYASTPVLPDVPACALAWDPVSGDVLSLSTSGTATLAEIDLLATNNPVATWTLGTDGVGIVVNSTGTAFVLEGSGGNVTAVNGSTGAILGSFRPGATPADALAIDSADGLLFLGLVESGTIEVASAPSLSLDGALDAPAPVGGLAFDPASGTLVGPVGQDGEVFLANLIPVPGAPTSLVATAGNDTAWLNWSAPLSSGPYPTDGYVVAAHPHAGVGVALRENTTAPTDAVHGLTDGVPYEVEVFAASFAGVGVEAAVATLTPTGIPYPPAAVLAAGTGPSTIEVGWATPLSDDGAPVSGYTVHYAPTGGAASALMVGNVTNATLTGLSASTEYAIWVTATNAVGTGNPSGTATGSTTAAVPPPPTSTSGVSTTTLVGSVAVGVVVAAVVGVLVGRRSRAPPAAPPESPA